MHSYKLKFHKSNVLMIVMIGIPVIFLSFLFYFLFSLSSLFSTPLLLTIVSVSIIVLTLILLWIKNTQIFVSTTVSISNKGIGFKLHKSFLYSLSDFFSEWDNVESITEMFDNNEGIHVYKIQFKNPRFVANFSALNNHELEAEKFFSELQYYQENFILSHLRYQLNAHRNKKIAN